jgi:class 3 adenylate cyclase
MWVFNPSGTVTFLFTDVEGSTALWQADEAAMRAAVARHDQLLNTAMEAHDGKVFSSSGDGFATAFQAASAAVAAAVAAQAVLESELWPTARPMQESRS